MPELPEVESFRRALNVEYRGKTIAKVYFRRKDLRYPLSPTIKKVLRKDAVLEQVGRDGKQLLLMTQYGTIQISLGMSGAFVPSSLSSPLPHEHVSICFSDGSVLGYIDPRRFGFWKIQIAHLPHLADPLRKTELIRLFANTQVRKSTRAIKDLLMDQKLIGGIGNIYALEALHISHIRPTRRAHRVLTHEWQSLAESIPTILAQAIDKGGSTVSTYRRLHGEDGNFQELHQVYDREKELCMRSTCTGIIKRVKQGGRSSWYCPKCQK